MMKTLLSATLLAAAPLAALAATSPAPTGDNLLSANDYAFDYGVTVNNGDPADVGGDVTFTFKADDVTRTVTATLLDYQDGDPNYDLSISFNGVSAAVNQPIVFKLDAGSSFDVAISRPSAEPLVKRVDYAFTVNSAPMTNTGAVPLPAALPLALAGFAGLGLIGRRRG